jgi:hypothetical protein
MTDKTDWADGPQRISGPGELLQAVPYLLGFHPQLSLVLVGLADGMLVVTARLDLADTGVPGVLDDTVAALTRGGTDEVIAVAYPGAFGDPDGWSGLALDVQAVAERNRIECGDVLLVVDDRWRSLLCATPQCCPPEGRPMSGAVSAFAAAATVAGLAPLDDREALDRTLDPLPEPDRQGLAPLLAEAEQAVEREVADGHEDRHERAVKRRLFAAARSVSPLAAAALDRAEGDRGGEVVDDESAVRFGVALRALTVRNAVWMAVDDGRLDGRDLWRDLARRLPSPYDAVPLFLYGWAVWRAGNGALASMAAARASVSDPDCTPALLLLAALEQAVDPRRLPRLRTSRPARTA